MGEGGVRWGMSNVINNISSQICRLLKTRDRTMHHDSEMWTVFWLSLEMRSGPGFGPQLNTWERRKKGESKKKLTREIVGEKDDYLFMYLFVDRVVSR